MALTSATADMLRGGWWWVCAVWWGAGGRGGPGGWRGLLVRGRVDGVR
jgi:hypothetical protein